jgi:mannosyltransferase OCH1-like enzyme
MRLVRAIVAIVAIVAVLCGLAVLSPSARQDRQKIPRIIHQTHSAPYAGMPHEYRKQASLVREMNPEYEYRFYSDPECELLIRRVCGDDSAVLRAYMSLNPAYGAAKADLFRYVLMYEHGGVYLDVKSSTTVPLRRVIRESDEYLLSSWCEGECGKSQWDSLVRTGVGEYQQWWIACVPRHPFLRAVIDACVDGIEAYRFDASDAWTFGKLGVLRLTGPIAYTRAIHPLLKQHGHRLATNSFNGAMLYSYTLRRGNSAPKHEDVETAHYSRLTTPIVRARMLDPHDAHVSSHPGFDASRNTHPSLQSW